MVHISPLTLTSIFYVSGSLQKQAFVHSVPEVPASPLARLQTCPHQSIHVFLGDPIHPTTSIFISLRCRWVDFHLIFGTPPRSASYSTEHYNT